MEHTTHPLLVSEVGSDESEGHRDAEPQGQQGHQRAERNSGTTAQPPQHQVEDEEDAEDDTEEGGGRIRG